MSPETVLLEGLVTPSRGSHKLAEHASMRRMFTSPCS